MVIAKSFARIHKANLINFGILPFTFADQSDYDTIEEGSKLLFTGLIDQIEAGREVRAVIEGGSSDGRIIVLLHDLAARPLKVVLSGGLLNYTRNKT
jgi:aconitate hydratase